MSALRGDRSPRVRRRSTTTLIANLWLSCPLTTHCYRPETMKLYLKTLCPPQPHQHDDDNSSSSPSTSSAPSSPTVVAPSHPVVSHLKKIASLSSLPRPSSPTGTANKKRRRASTSAARDPRRLGDVSPSAEVRHLSFPCWYFHADARSTGLPTLRSISSPSFTFSNPLHSSLAHVDSLAPLDPRFSSLNFPPS